MLIALCYCILSFAQVATPEQYGARADGVHDDSKAIQKALENCTHLKMTGVYAVSKTIIVKDQSITLDKTAKIVAIGAQMDYMFKYVGTKEVVYLDGGGVIDCNGKCGGIFYDSPKTFRLQNLYITGMSKNPSLYMNNGFLESYDINCDRENVAKAQQPEYSVVLKGGSDHKLDRWTIITSRKGISGCGHADILSRVHIYGGVEVGFEVTGPCTFNMCYTDYCKIGFDVKCNNYYATLHVVNHNTTGNKSDVLINCHDKVLRGTLTIASHTNYNQRLVQFAPEVSKGQSELEIEIIYNIPRKGRTVERPNFGSSEDKDTMAGFTFYDMNLKKLILWNGDKWVNLDGSRL